MSQKSSLSLAVRQILLIFQWCVLISLSQRHQIHTKHFQRVTSCPILSARHARDMRRTSALVMAGSYRRHCITWQQTQHIRRIARPAGTYRQAARERIGCAFASWCINRHVDGGLELPLKLVQTRLDHASIQMTADRYGHLFPRGDDDAELAAAETAYLRKQANGSWKVCKVRFRAGAVLG